MNKVINEKNSMILITLQAAGGQFMNSHNGKMDRAVAVGVYNKGDKQYIIPLYENTYFSINPIELDENGVPTLSRMSVGGVVHTSGRTIEEGIVAHNEDNINSTFEWQRDNLINVDIHRFN